LCVETQGREIMAVLVNDVIAEALRLGLYDQAPKPLAKVNGARIARRQDRVRNG
jgi:hypothetical protein